MKTTIENPRISGTQTSFPLAEDDLGIEPVVESSVQFPINPDTSLVASPFPDLNPVAGPIFAEESEPEIEMEPAPVADFVPAETELSETSEPILWESAAERVDAQTAGNALGIEQDKLRIPEKTFFKIGEVADILKLKPYVLRYWETEFPFAAPEKKASGQRVYRRAEVETLVMIKHLLYNERYSIEGARKRIKELRKEGDLRKYKKETIAENVAQSAISPEKKKRILESLDHLRELARKTESDFFRF